MSGLFHSLKMSFAMAQKTYIATSRLTLPVVVAGKVQRYVNFYDEKNTFTTDDPSVQKALEALPLFGSVFSVFRSGSDVRPKVPAADSAGLPERSGPDDPCSNVNEKEETGFLDMPQITDWQAAREALKAEPYNVAYQALASPEAILKKAEEYRIRFPNLTL